MNMNELQRYLVEEAVEDYEEGRLARREALKAIAGITGAARPAQMLGARAQVAPAGKAPASSAPLVAPDDPSIVAGIAEFPGEGVRLDGYLARPAGAGRHAIVLVCHENRGLTRHIEDVARRVAKAGYVGLAVDLLSREGGTAERINQNIPAIESSMGKHGKTFRKIVYPNVDHAFHNDTGARYNAAAAKAAWGEALAWFGKYLA